MTYNIEENVPSSVPSFLGRFLRTFLISFVVTAGVLWFTGMIPPAFYDIPRSVYLAVVSRTMSQEAVLAAVLPQPSNGTSLQIASSTLADRATNDNDRGIDWSDRSWGDNGVLPTLLSIPTVAIYAPIVIPQSTDVSVLDAALTDGIVYYPGSGVPGERSNVLLFGHSSHLPVVNNPAYKALNGLEYVRLGDDVFVETTTQRYHYRVSAVRLTSADEELVLFRSDRRMITISTCNTFGNKSERFVAEAILVGVTSKS